MPDLDISHSIDFELLSNLSDSQIQAELAAIEELLNTRANAHVSLR
jgi:hypothetical protein